MPPSLSQKDKLDELLPLVSPSTVTVYREKHGVPIDFGAGFIIYGDSNKTLVCVHPSLIKDGEDLSVIFNDATTQNARVFFNDDANRGHSVLVVNNLTSTTRSQVIFCEEPVKREEIFTIAAVESLKSQGLMSGRIITPDCTAYTEDKVYVPGSRDLFAMSCPAGGVSPQRPRGNAARIVGAAVFNLEGQVIGTIKSIDPSGFDTKFSAKVGSFLQALEQSLQTLDKKVLISRSQRVSGKESSSQGDGTSQSHQGGTVSGSASKIWSVENVPGSDNRTEKGVDQLEVIVKMPNSPGQDDMLLRRPKTIRRLVDKQVPKMLSERVVSTIYSNGKQKFSTTNGGDLHPANPYEQEEFGSSSNSGQLVWSILSKHAASSWAESIVSLTSFDEGGSIHASCTGIVVDHTKTRAYILGSLSLYRSSDDDRKINYNMTIRTAKISTKVRLPNNQVVNGILLSHDSTHNLAIVRVLPEGGCVRAACLDHHQQFESHCQVVAVRRCFSSGKLMATTGMLDGNPMGAYCEEGAAGGVLIDFLGNVVGLNCYYGKNGTTFARSSTMLEFLAGFQKARAEKRARSADLRRRLVSCWDVPMKKYELKGKAIKLKKRSPSDMSCLEGSSRMENKQLVCRYCDPEGLPAHGDRFRRLFPGPSWPAGGDDSGMRLLCNFEEEFGEDIWSKLTEEVASGMSQCVVALASFSGDKRGFACTGIIIGSSEFTTRVLTSASLVRNSDDEAKVADNLKIEVCLPDNEHATGTLQHYNLCYNIAVITIMGSRCTQAAKIYDQLLTEPHGKVAAVGRVYESGKLIATGGTLIEKPSELDCKELKMSTCKITKAGIGGPLIDGDGNFIGVDFYGLEETPYLPRNKVLEVLGSFDAKPDAPDLISDHNPNRWPVPKPFWCYPTWHQYMGEGVKVGIPQKPAKVLFS